MPNYYTVDLHKMACAAPVDISNDFECSICLQPFQEPCILPCKHSFCYECLTKWAEAGDDRTVVVCPKCKATVAIPSTGVRNFLVNRDSKAEGEENSLHQGSKVRESLKPECTNCQESGKTATVRCMDCKDFLCDPCYVLHKQLKKMRHHAIISVEDLNSATEALSIDARYCSKHDKELKKYYCETCQCLICSDCLLLTHKPPEHQSLRIKEASEKCKDIMGKLLQDCNDKRTSFQTAIDHNDKVMESVKSAMCQAKLSLDEVSKDVQMTLAKYLQEDVELHKSNIVKFEEERCAQIGNVQCKLKTELGINQEACEKCMELIQSGSSVDITSSFSSLSKDMQQFIQTTPQQDNSEIPDVQFQAAGANLNFPLHGLIVYKDKWTLLESHNIILDDMDMIIYGILDIVINDRNIFVATSNKVYRHTGSGSFTIHSNKCNCLTDTISTKTTSILGCAISSDKRLIVAYRKDKYVQFCDYKQDSDSQYLNPHLTHMGKFMPEDNFVCIGVEVDKKGQIIIGDKNTIYICYGSGTLDHSFKTQNEIQNFATTSQERLVVVLQKWTVAEQHTKTGRRRKVSVLCLLDYHGGIISEIQSPPEVGKDIWRPIAVCGRKDEIFVGNNGNHTVYRYTENGEYLNCVISYFDINLIPARAPFSYVPRLSISQDGKKLIILLNTTGYGHHYQRIIKIVQKKKAIYSAD